MQCEEHEFEVLMAPASGPDEPVELRCPNCGRRWPVASPLPLLFDWHAEGMFAAAAPGLTMVEPPTEESEHGMADPPG